MVNLFVTYATSMASLQRVIMLGVKGPSVKLGSMIYD